MIRKTTFVLTIVGAVTQLHAATVLLYNFDEGPLNQPASIPVDSSGNNIQGVAKNIGAASLPIYRNAPSGGFQLELSGHGDAVPTAASYIEIADPGVSPLDLTGPLTIEAVIRPTLIDNGIIVRKFTLAGSGYYFGINSTGHILLNLQDDNTRAISTPTLQPNKTYHVAGTWDGSTMRVYVNHTLQGQFAYNGPLVANDDELTVGAMKRITDTIDDGFAGFMDSVRISNTALGPNDFLPNPEPPGDYNRNGFIDAADYVVWRDQVGQIVPGCSGADANCDTFVAVGEYQPWKENFGWSYSSSANAIGSGYNESAANVPEPASLLLGVLGIVTIAVSEVRKRLEG